MMDGRCGMIAARRTAILFLLLACVSLSAAEKVELPWYRSTVPQTSVPTLGAAPAIDGAIAEAEWETAGSFTGLISPKNPYVLPEPLQARVWYGRLDGSLYFAFRSPVPPNGLKIKTAERDAANDIEGGDHWEIHFLIGDKARSIRYILKFNHEGGFSDQRVTPEDKGKNRHQAGIDWDSQAELATRVAGDVWEAEIRFPVSVLGYPEGIPDGTAWRAMFQRQRSWDSMDNAMGEWNGARGHFMSDQAGMLLFGPPTPSVQIRELGALRDNRLEPVIHVANPTAEPRQVRVRLAVESGDEVLDEQVLTTDLAPGAAQQVPFKGTDFAFKPGWSGRVMIAADSGEDHLYSHSIQTIPMSAAMYRFYAHWPYGAWPFESPFKDWWELECAYYPYFTSMDAAVDTKLTYLGDRYAAAASAVLRLTDAAGQELRADTVPVIDGRAQCHWDELDLPEGEYALTGQLQDVDGKALGVKVTRTFERRRFPWEHNTIGISDDVFAPFEPIRTDAGARTMRFWGRTYGIGPGGLPGAVVAGEEQPVAGRTIAAAMRLQVTRGEDTAVFAGQGDVAAAEPGIVRITGTSTAPGFSARVDAFAQYDGWYEVDLTVTPDGTQAVDRLELVVPLGSYPDTLWFYRERASVGAGDLPPGDGVIWRNLKKRGRQVQNLFTPVLAIGDGDTAYWWYADSDRDWRLNYDLPSQEIHRDADGNVSLHLLLVNDSAELGESLRTRFAILTNPARPDPPSRRFLIWGGHGRIHDTSGYAYWGTGVDSISIGDPVHQAELAACTAKVTAERGPELLDRIEAWSGRRDAPQPVIFYNSGELLGPAMAEFPTFSGEWAGQSGMEYTPEYPDSDLHSTVTWMRCLQQDWRSQPRALGPARADLVQSCVDARVWHYKRNMEMVGMNGYWFDNASIWPGTKVSTGRAYRTPNGDVRPTYPVFNRRQTFRRLFVLYKQAGKEPCTLINGHTSWVFAGWRWVLEGDAYIYRHGGDLFETLERHHRYDIISRVVEVEETPLDPVGRFRAHHCLRRIPGSMVSNLHPRDESGIHGSRSVIGLSLLHDFGVEGGVYPAELNRTRKILRDFGFFRNDAIVFTPYWRNGKVAGFTVPKVLVSTWQNPDTGAVLAVIVNPFTEDQTGDLTLKIGSGDLVDPETEQQLETRTEGGATVTSLTVPAREFRLVLRR